MPLVPYLDPETAEGKAKEILVNAKGRFERRLGDMAQGLIPNSMRLMAHRPEILEGFNHLCGGVNRKARGGGPGDPETSKTSLFSSRNCGAHHGYLCL